MEEMIMAENSRDDGPNPPLVIGAPVRPTSLGELIAWHAYQGTLGALLIDIGHYTTNLPQAIAIPGGSGNTAVLELNLDWINIAGLKARGQQEKRFAMDLELEKFKTEIDLRLYATGQGYLLDRKESWAGSAVMRNPNTNDKIIIKRDADGHHVYFSVRDDSDNGTILDFAKRRLGVSLGAARKELRAFMGLPTSALPPYPPLVKVVKDRIRVERAYARMQVALRHPYLENERGIPRQILGSRRFAGRIRIDGHGNAIFPHFDADGLSGFEMKNHRFTGFSTGGTKGLWLSKTSSEDRRLVVCESAIDALSHAVLFPDGHTRYSSIGGKPNPVQPALIQAAIVRMPSGSEIVAATDADQAGRDLAAVIHHAFELSGRSDVRFQMHDPSSGFKDFNDQLRGKHIRSFPAARPQEPSVAG
jgi:hypothetical protein